jgi:autotransporter-associated beta strand protein
MILSDNRTITTNTAGAGTTLLNHALNISGLISGDYGILKTGAGTLSPRNTANNFTGDVTVQTGILDAHRGALGTTEGKTYINSTGSTSTGGQLSLNANGVVYNEAEDVVIQGTGTAANGSGTPAIRFAGSTACNMEGSITLDGNANYKIDVYLQPSHWTINGGIARSGANTGTLFLDLQHYQQATPVRLTINSTIDNNGGPVTLLGNSGGVLQMDTAGHDLGAFTINGENAATYQTILKLGIDDALTTNQNLTITKGVFDLAGFDQTVNALSGVALNSRITNTDAAPSTLTIGNGGGGAAFSGLVAAGGAGAISLVKVGAGTATLSSNSTDMTNTGFIGGITVNEGTLHLNANRQLSPVSNTIASGATLQLNINNVTDSMTFNGEGTLQTGTAIFSVPRVATYALGAAALINVTDGAGGGQLWVNPSSVWTANLSDMTVASGANLYTAYGNVRVDALTGSGTVNLSPGTVDGDFGLTLGVNNGSGQFDGNFIDYFGAGSLRKVGSGTQTLSGTLGYSGATNVAGGTLVLKQINTANESSTVTIASGAVLGLDFVGSDTVDKLFFGATQQPMGTYSASSVPAGATITPASFSFGGSLEVTTGAAVSNPYDTWAASKGLTVANNGKSDNPDNDSQNNLGEFAFNGDPLSGSDNGKVFVLTEDSDFDVDAIKELILTVAVRTGTPAFAGSPSPSANLAADAITYTIEGSLDLGSFSTTVNVVPTPVITGLPAAGAGYEYRSFSLDGSNGLTGKGFLRAKVTSP